MAYFANGSDGEYLEDQCIDCPLSCRPCPVYAVQNNYNYKQCSKGNEDLRAAMNLLIDEKGNCKMLEALAEAEYRSCPVCGADPDPMSDVIAQLDKRSKT